MDGIELIAKERRRQIEEENWTEEHDDDHTSGELALAAACFASPILLFEKEDRYVNQTTYRDPFPWEGKWDRRYTDKGGNVIQAPETLYGAARIDILAKAGALIAAEIDRLERASKRPPSAEILVDILSLVFENPPDEDTVEEWSDGDKLAAQNWAGDVHIAASDNDIEVGPKPEFLKQYR